MQPHRSIITPGTSLKRVLVNQTLPELSFFTLTSTSVNVISCKNVKMVLRQFRILIDGNFNFWYFKKNKHKPHKRKRRKTITKWFDNDLDKLREKVLAQGKIYSKFPKDPVIRGHYYKLCREYNKLRKTKIQTVQSWNH